MPVSDEIKRIYASAPPKDFYIETLELEHSQFTKNWFLTNDDISWNFLLENGNAQVFETIPFRVNLPASNAGGDQEMQIVIANVGKQITDEIEAAATLPTEPIKARYRIYINRIGSAPQNDPVLELSISGISIDAEVITATATRFDILNRRFPRIKYTTDEFIGLKR